MLARQRQEQIINTLKHLGGVRVCELSRDLAVSEMTIRRDLSSLEQQGRLARIHGGAVLVDITSEPDYAAKADLLAPEKMLIAKAAAAMAREGVIGLNAGTTTAAIASCLPRDNDRLTVVTNAVNIAWTLAATSIKVILTGGSLRSNSYALVGPAQDVLDRLWLDIMFLGANGVSIHGGITTPNQAEAETNARLLARARKVVVVADHSKLGKTAFGHIADLRRADLLITSREADREFVEEAEKLGLEVQLI